MSLVVAPLFPSRLRSGLQLIENVGALLYCFVFFSAIKNAHRVTETKLHLLLKIQVNNNMRFRDSSPKSEIYSGLTHIQVVAHC